MTTPKLFMVIERFRNGNAEPVYRRFREQGTLAPKGVEYVNSWVDPAVTMCFQVMQTHDRALLDQWMANWSDVADFEVLPVITSAEAAAIMTPK